MHAKTTKRGRYSVTLWAPFTWHYNGKDDDGWNNWDVAWTWRRPRRWRWPSDGIGGTSRPVLVQGVRLWAIDVRRVSREPLDG